MRLQPPQDFTWQPLIKWLCDIKPNQSNKPSQRRVFNRSSEAQSSPAVYSRALHSVFLTSAVTLSVIYSGWMRRLRTQGKSCFFFWWNIFETWCVGVVEVCNSVLATLCSLAWRKYKLFWCCKQIPQWIRYKRDVLRVFMFEECDGFNCSVIKEGVKIRILQTYWVFYHLTNVWLPDDNLKHWVCLSVHHWDTGETFFIAIRSSGRPSRRKWIHSSTNKNV